MAQSNTLYRRAQTAGIAIVGTVAFLLLGLPLPFLFGPMLACLLAALFGAPLMGFGIVSTTARTILGLAVGTSLTPAVVEQLPQMAASIALVPFYIAAIVHNVVRPDRIRLGAHQEIASLTPMEALERYLTVKETPTERIAVLRHHAELLPALDQS